jgi:inorganic pyrophosphatase
VPQTWEDPNFDHEYTGFPGDNDPVDLFDVSGIDEGYVGQVKQVKILGALAMVDVSCHICSIKRGRNESADLW